MFGSGLEVQVSSSSTNRILTSTWCTFRVKLGLIPIRFIFWCSSKIGLAEFLDFGQCYIPTMPRWLLLVATIASIHGAAEPFPTPPEQTDEQISVMDFLWFFEAGNQGIARRRGE